MAEHPTDHAITNYRISVGELSEWSSYLEASLRCVIKVALRTQVGDLLQGYTPRPFSPADLRELSESFAKCEDNVDELHRPLVQSLLDHLGYRVGEELTYDSSPEYAVMYCCWPTQGGPWQAGAVYSMRYAKTRRPWLLDVLGHSVPMYLKLDWDCPKHVADPRQSAPERELLQIKTLWPKLAPEKRKQLLELAQRA